MSDLRRATSADVAPLARIAEAAYAPYMARLAGRRPAPMDADYHRLVDEAEAWVAESDGDVVGFLILIHEDDATLLDNVGVDPAHQREGVGRALLAWAERRAREAGRDRVRLYTNEAMVENQRLYERIGYVETHRAVAHGFARVFYEKRLTAP